MSFQAGYGSLELYPLTPTEEDQAEVKKLEELWLKSAPNLAAALTSAGRGPTGVKQAALPLVSSLSQC